MAVGSQKGWSPSRSAFQRLLNWLDDGLPSGGERYLETRRRLVKYFDRKSCPSPDELADETLNRVTRRLEEENTITDTVPARYCYIVARFVFLEHLRRAGRAQVSLEGLAFTAEACLVSPKPEISLIEEERLACLERCLSKLNSGQRELILEYYHGDQRAKIDNRRNLALKLGLTMNALNIRACRIRDTLEDCVRSCCSRR